MAPIRGGWLSRRTRQHELRTLVATVVDPAPLVKVESERPSVESVSVSTTRSAPTSSSTTEYTFLAVGCVVVFRSLAVGFEPDRGEPEVFGVERVLQNRFAAPYVRLDNPRTFR